MANQIYPFAVSLIESVRMYEGTCDKVMCFAVVYDFGLRLGAQYCTGCGMDLVEKFMD